VAAMQKLGADATIIVPNRLTQLGHLSVRDLAVALTNGYIDYMLDKVVDPDHGIYAVVVVPVQEPELAAELVERTASHPAVVGVCFMTLGANPPLGDVRYSPIYEAAQAHALPIVFHSSPGLNLTEGSSPVDGFQRLIESHSLGFSIGNMAQLTSVLLQGVPERFPKLKFLFQESGVFWVPMMMYRLDEYYLKRREEAPLLKMLPSEYVLDRFYFGTQPLEAPKQPKHLQAIFEMADGYDHFLYSSDYPHFDFDDAVAILNLPFLSSEQKQKVLAGNALSLFNFQKEGVPAWLSTWSERQKISEKASTAS
jgi:predicted TIM-barrel fold metal-dependent hydrolase